MHRLEDNPDLLDLPLNHIPRVDDDNHLIDIRGSLLLYVRKSVAKDSFGELFGQKFSLVHLINDDCRFRIHQKSKYSSLKLKYYHPKWKMVFKFSVKDTISNQKFWKMHLHQLFGEMTVPQYFDGCYANTIFRQPDHVVLEKARFEELKERSDLWLKEQNTPKPTFDRFNPKIVVSGLDTLSTLELLEEVERRYKAANPDWAADLLARAKPDDELSQKVVSLFGT
jgi:hypothetical protein